MNKKTPIALGVLLLAGALFGSFSTLKNVVNYIPDGNWSFGGTQLLFLLAFVYIATVGFKLIKNDSNVANQAKWIFLLQAPIISIQGLFHWSWSTGLQGLVGYSSKYGVLTHFPIPLYQAGANFHLQPADTIVGINLVALGLAWVAHKISKQAAHMPTDTLLNNVQPQVKNLGNAAQISAGLNNYALGALLQKWTIVSNLIKLVLGALLIYGSIAGAVGTLEYIDGYFSDNDYLKGSIYVLYLLTFIYIGVVGFKLSGHFGRVIKQAKWIFVLQVPMLNIPHMINWSWSTGVGANIGFEGGQFLLDMPQLQEADMNFLYPDDEFGLALNLAALLFAYLLHLLGKQSLKGQNSAKQVFPAEATNTQVSEDHYVQAYQELQTKTQDIATWAKALATSNGDNDMAEATYLRMRVESLQSKGSFQPQVLESKNHHAQDLDALRGTATESYLARALKALAMGTIVGALVFAFLIALQDGDTDLGVSLMLGASLSALMMLTLIIFSIPMKFVLRKFKGVSWRYSLLISVLFCALLAYLIALVLDYGNANHVKINAYELLAYFSTLLCCCLIYIYKVLLSVYGHSQSIQAINGSFKKKLAAGIGAITLAILLVFSGTLAKLIDERLQQVVGASEQVIDKQLEQRLIELERYKIAADDAENRLMCYENFNNKSYDIALQKCHAVALKFDDPTAQKWLGYMYADGHGTEKDIPKAIDWLLKAAHQGEVLAELKIGEIYDTTYESNIYKDDKKAFEWYMKAAQQGLYVAQSSVGRMYLDGQGIEKNDKNAFEWFMKAATQGSAYAQNEVGVMYYKGLGVNKDEQKAVEWLRKAADQGLVSAKESLANMGY